MPPRKAKSTPSSTPQAAAPAARSEIKGSGTAPKAPAAPRIITSDMIRLRAYDIYASRGFAPGNPDEDWMEAERQLKAGL